MINNLVSLWFNSSASAKINNIILDPFHLNYQKNLNLINEWLRNEQKISDRIIKLKFIITIFSSKKIYPQCIDEWNEIREGKSRTLKCICSNNIMDGEFIIVNTHTKNSLALEHDCIEHINNKKLSEKMTEIVNDKFINNIYKHCLRCKSLNILKKYSREICFKCTNKEKQTHKIVIPENFDSSIISFKILSSENWICSFCEKNYSVLDHQYYTGDNINKRCFLCDYNHRKFYYNKNCNKNNPQDNTGALYIFNE